MLVKKDFIDLLKNYDFINNSIRSFSKKYNIHYNTVSKYLRENDIQYNRKESELERKRDASGKFSISVAIENASKNNPPLRDLPYRQNLPYETCLRQHPTKCRTFKDLQNLKL